jgi:Tfp pilus assembly protein PilO
MGARHADRLWMIAGAAVVALLGIATWFLAVSPQRTEASDLKNETETVHAQADDLRARIAQLNADKANLTALKRTLNARQEALPADSGVPAFLRQLQATGTAVRVNVKGFTVGDPAPEEAVPEVWALPIQLTAEGTAARLTQFLTQLQDADQKRAVLIQVTDLASGNDGAAAGDQTLNLTIKAFVAPPAGAGAPTITTD